MEGGEGFDFFAEVEDGLEGHEEGVVDLELEEVGNNSVRNEG